jgi:hypothetical protein
MAMMSSSVDAFLRQWLATAGLFSLTYAWQTDRMQLRCGKCSAILRVPQLEKADEVPFVLADWVQQHGHNGNHGVEPKLPLIKVVLSPVPVTADFKPVTARIAKGRRFR